MKKKISLKNQKSLKLHRETLSALGKLQLTAVAGGISTTAQCKKLTVPC